VERKSNLAYVFSSIFHLNYDETFERIKAYQNALAEWIFSVFASMITESCDTVRKIFKKANILSQYISKSVIKIKNLSIYGNEFSKKQLYWFGFAFWLQKYAHGNSKFKKCVEESIDVLEDKFYRKEEIKHDIGKLLYELVNHVTDISTYTKIATRIGHYVGHCGNETDTISNLICLVNRPSDILCAIRLMQLII